ncbi:MAG: hypothetical protein CR982_10145, partial [Candidatus Cloacimonadota bacterium]
MKIFTFKISVFIVALIGLFYSCTENPLDFDPIEGSVLSIQNKEVKRNKGAVVKVDYRDYKDIKKAIVYLSGDSIETVKEAESEVDLKISRVKLGKHIVKVDLFDNSGNTESDSISISIKGENNKPSISISEVDPFLARGDTLNFEINAIDSIDGYIKQINFKIKYNDSLIVENDSSFLSISDSLKYSFITDRKTKLGKYKIIYSTKDIDNDVKLDSVLFQVYNRPPSDCKIETPLSGEQFSRGDSVKIEIITEDIYKKNLKDGGTIEKVVIFIDGEEEIEIFSAPYIYNWETSGSNSVGEHSIVARSYDTDGGFTESDTIVVKLNNVKPVIDIPSTTINFTENSSSTLLVDESTQISITDADRTKITKAEVSITVNYISGKDSLLIDTTPNGINSTFENGTLTLEGKATLEEYQNLLKEVKYKNSSDSPNSENKSINLNLTDRKFKLKNFRESSLKRTISWKVFDEEDGGSSDEAKTYINVIDVNDAPVITGQETLSTQEETPITLELANLTVNDPDNNYPNGFTLSVSAGENYNVFGNTITPNTDFNGGLTVPVKVSDGTTDSDPYDVLITVTAENDTPTISLPASFTFDEDGTLEEDLAQYVNDDDGDQLTLSASTNENIFVTFAGLLATFTATPNYNGTEVVTITVSDNNGKSIASDDVEIVVNPVNDAPTIELPDSFAFDEDDMLEEDLSTYINDVDGDQLTLSVSDNSNVMVTFVGTVATFTAVENYNGTETITITVNDNQSKATASDTVEIVVNPVNDTPTIELPDSFAFDEDGMLEEDLSTYINDVDGDQ